MNDESDLRRKELLAATPDELITRIKTCALEQQIRLSPAGFPLAIDAGLSSEPEFDQQQLSGLSSLLLPRWADLYIQDIDRELPSLIALRDRHADMAARATNAIVEQWEFDSNERIHNEEISAGWYTIQRDVSALEYSSQAAWSTSAQAAAKVFNDITKTNLVDWRTQSAEMYASYRANAAFASLFPVYSDVHAQHVPPFPKWDESKFNFMNIDLANSLNEPPKVTPAPTGPVVGNWFSVPRQVWSLVYASALPETVFNVASVNSQQVLAEGSAQSAASLAQSKDLLAKWYSADETFRRERTQVALDTNAMRKLARSSKRGPTNYSEQLQAIRQEFIQRISQVYARALIIDVGLRDIWEMPLPPLPDVYKWNDDTSFFSSFISWIGILKRSMLMRSASDCNTVLTVSVSSLVGPQVWTKAMDNVLASNATSVEFRFELPTTLTQYSQTRLRGVIAYITGIDDRVAGLWRAKIVPPKHARLGTNSLSISQDQPSVDLARIQSRENPKPPDVVGMATLRNIVPFSNPTDLQADRVWVLVLERYSLRNADGVKVTDIELDFLTANSL